MPLCIIGGNVRFGLKLPYETSSLTLKTLRRFSFIFIAFCPAENIFHLHVVTARVYSIAVSRDGQFTQMHTNRGDVLIRYRACAAVSQRAATLLLKN